MDPTTESVRQCYLSQFENLKALLRPVVDKITGVIHVGGSFCYEHVIYTDMGIDGNNIYYFEANPEIVERIKDSIPHIYQAAISSPEDEDKILELIITNNSWSSSLLALKKHSEVHPSVVEEKRIPVRCNTLDRLQSINKYWPEDKKPNVLVIDIQGNELKAFKGMEETLKHIDYIYTEVNLVEMYEGCGLFSDLHAFLENHDFEMVGKFTNAIDGDVSYKRKSVKAKNILTT
ncbi:MAG: FkbM family methyltransferase [Nitrososphaerales archaeon]